MNSHANRTQTGKPALALAAGILIPLLFLTLLMHAAHARALQSPHAVICVKPGGGDGCQPTVSNALAIANAGDTIRVAAGDYVENVLVDRAVLLEGGWNDDFTARDPAAYPTTIRPADETQSVVSILDADPTLDGFTITGGRADLGNNHGGGLRLVNSDAVLRNNAIVDNRAYLFGGGLWVQRGAPRLENNRIENNRSLGPNQDAFGGGVHLENTAATLVNNLIAANVVSGTNAFGGGVGVVGSAEPRLLDNQVLNNRALAVELGVGGGIGADEAGALYLAHNLVAGNHVTVTAGPPFAGVHAAGGGVGLLAGADLQSSRDVIHSNSVFATPEAGVDPLAYGGGLYQREGRLLLHTVAISANVSIAGGGVYVRDALFELAESTIAANHAGAGGGIVLRQSPGKNLIRNSAIRDNQADVAAGLLQYGGALTVHGSAVSGNVAAQDEAGGIYAYYLMTGDALTVTNTTVEDNHARVAAGIYAGTFLHLDATSIRHNVATEHAAGLLTTYAGTVQNSAVYENQAGGYGAALLHDSGQPLTLQNVTISGNESGSSGAVYFDGDAALLNATVSENSPGGVFWQSGDVTTQNSIFAANDGANCNAPLDTLGYNLEDADDCGLDAVMNDLLFADPLLGPLSDNGGETPTHALAPASPAVDAAYNDACAAHDQRARPRVDGDFDGDITCDVGAFERLSSFLVNSTADQVDAVHGDGLCETAPGSAQCTLRAAIQEANALGGAETISVPAGVYALTIANPPPAAPQAPALDTDDFAASGDLDVRVYAAIAGAGPAGTIVDAQELDRVFHVVNPDDRPGAPRPHVQLSGLTLRNGRAERQNGGGIYNDGVLTLVDSAVLASRTADPDNARAGGGIFNNHTLLLDHVLLAANQSDDGGALFTEGQTGTRLQYVTVRDNVASQSAGGVNNNGALTITHSTLSANSAAMFNGGAILNNDTVWLENVTLSANVAAGFGGALNNANQAIFHSVTVAHNQAQDGGGIYNDGEVLLHNTILAANAGGNCVDNDTLQSLGYNLEDANSCSLDPAHGDLLNAVPRLGPLQDNGGATLTHALLPGSPAVDAGSLLRCPPTDQRATPRPLDGDGDNTPRCDIGAYEHESQTPKESVFWLHLPVLFN